MFIDYLLRNKIDNKLYMLGFIVAVFSYSFWKPIEGLLEFSEENSGTIYYMGGALAFCCYTSAYMFTKWNSWRWFPMFVALICLSRLGNEIWFFIYPEDNPEKYNIFDYLNFLITIWVVFNYFIKHQHKKYLESKQH